MLPDVLALAPATRPPDLSVRVPGSKSITNRALLCAGLAVGGTTLTGALFADDTRAMIDAVRALGARVVTDEPAATISVSGVDPRATATVVTVDARNSGTTSRFILPAVALAAGSGRVDGGPQLRRRPFGPLIDALRQLGVTVAELGRPGCLPVEVAGPAAGGTVRIPGHLSSQFLSGLLMAAPLMRDGLTVELTSPLVSVPYLTMTTAVMAAFGVEIDGLRVGPAAYRAREYAIEPDASAASYFLGAAAITGGRITVDGLGTASLQGDVAFADALERMGARIERSDRRLTVTGTGELHGIDIDMVDISDTAQTLACVAVFADTPTRVRGIGFIRRKETDRLAAIVTELRRAGIDAIEHDDGFTVNPGTPRPTRFATYDDHRMAMSLSLLGLRVPGIEIADPGCVSKTYPGFFTDLARLTAP
ncbi:MAG: 3-phosphoshikimate 1-carboxyvinyltransferase [Micromonosporaceae bacterium]|nr:3-phosphoshikimate 1-carboxyvinyltransferase [Micromonosporaceae bacterium]